MGMFLYRGNIFKVQQFNHGMQSDGNRVDINGIEPNSIPVSLTADLTATSTTLTVGSGNTTTFATAEGISTATGYVKVGSEIIYYDGIGSDKNFNWQIWRVVNLILLNILHFSCEMIEVEQV